MKKDKINLKDIPKEIPIFPLSNAIFFPNTVLPLNIFEPRYKQMTEDALKNSKLIGMAQPNLQTIDPIKPRIFEVGCLGKVENYSETKDGRYLINLKGVTRFKVIKEINNDKLYRTFEVSYEDFSNDVEEEENTIDQKNLLELIDKTKKFFKMFQLSTDWQVVEKVKPDQLINSLAMICPFTTGEKQRLLETTTLEERNNILNQIINFYILSNQSNSQKNIH